MSPPPPLTTGATPSFAATLAAHGRPLTRAAPRVLQVNVGKLCNLTCIHCHVNAGPKRKEIMTGETVDRILAWLGPTPIEVVDLTGGTPEMIPDFRRLVEEVRALGRRVMVRCNLTILNEPGYEWVADFYRRHRIEVIASMPCYNPENVNEQRGDGVFDSSISALRQLNALGYGRDPDLELHLVYNPNGDRLPPPQAELEADYKRELRRHFGIEFNHLYVITNMPIARFASWLRRNGRLDAYHALLADNFNPASVEGLMCRDTISVDWQGAVFDCDFNQQLDLHLGRDGGPLRLWEVDLDTWRRTPIRTGSHCFGCTAGQGSSCGGAVAEA
ncbi:MAG: radical SAM/Cys-rich domain protein [Puniceicoccaceae bacterium]|nr:MAG: radical SAM/Cys-rich domain protein [Puniceicoccaceae bacterium]